MAIFQLRLTISLKIPDNEARSALEAIRVKMGLDDEVRDLTREERWELGVDAVSFDDAKAVVEKLVATTNLFANPNKHRYTLARADVPFGGPDPSVGADLADDEVAILVSDRESAEGDSILSAIRRLGVTDVRSARKWVRWRVALTRTPSPEEPDLLPLIRRIGVATGRRDGLLSNPHSQVSRVVLPWGEEKPLES
jgi:phosphoribosylformylglycinamidine (FGAM) synthase PurS component